MENTTLRFNENRLEYKFKCNEPGSIIKVINVYVHLPNESSLNKQSIEWALKLKPVLKMTYKNGTETFVHHIDISFLEKIYDGRPVFKADDTTTNSTKISGKKIVFTECEVTLEYNAEYSTPDIEVSLELINGVVLEEEVVSL